MAKIIKITKSSWQLGWIDGLERQVGRNAAVDGLDREAYSRGVERARVFIERISATRTTRRRLDLDEAEAAE